LREVRAKVADSDVEAIVTTDDGKDLPALQNGKKSKIENFNYILESLQSLVGTVSNAIRRYNETPFVVSEVLDCTIRADNNQERYIAHSAPLAFFVNTPIDKVLEDSQQGSKTLKTAVLKEIRHQIEVLRRYNIMHYNTSESGKYVIGEVRFLLEYKTKEGEQKSKIIALPIIISTEIKEPLGFLDPAEQKQLENAILDAIIAFDKRDPTEPDFLFTKEELQNVDEESFSKNIHSIGLYIRTASQCLVRKKEYNKVCKKCAGSDEEGKAYREGDLLTGNSSMSQGMIDGAKAVITAPNPIDDALVSDGERMPEKSFPMKKIQERSVRSLLQDYSRQMFRQETPRAEKIMLELELENIGGILQQLAPRRAGSSQIPMYRHYALGEILDQIEKDNFFAQDNQENNQQNKQQPTVRERLGRKTTLYITLTKQDAASEERILGIIDEVQEQVNLIGRYIQNTTEEAKREAQNLAANVMIRDIVFVVSETSTKEQIKSILEQYKNPTTNNQRTRDNLQIRFRRVVGVVSTEDFSEQTKRKYALLSRKLLGITEKDLRDALMTNDDMIAIMIGDALVTSQTTKDSEKGKQIIKLARKINKPSVVFDEIRYQVPSPNNPEVKVWESRWGFSYYSLPFLTKTTLEDIISERIKSKSNNAKEARTFKADLSIKT
jgi:hypothetical protein